MIACSIVFACVCVDCLTNTGCCWTLFGRSVAECGVSSMRGRWTRGETIIWGEGDLPTWQMVFRGPVIEEMSIHLIHDRERSLASDGLFLPEGSIGQAARRLALGLSTIQKVSTKQLIYVQ